MEEEWRDISGYEGRYQVSSLGRIKSIARCFLVFSHHEYCMPERIMRQLEHYNGYRTVWLRSGGRRKHKHRVHRLVAVAFIPNPEDKPIVNHKDGVRHNNAHHNLEWMDESENVRHGNVRRAAMATANDDMPF